MITLLSPAKKLVSPTDTGGTHPHFAAEQARLAELMQNKTAADLQQMMGISQKLAELNHQRYQQMAQGTAESAPAMMSFAGDVYQGLQAQDFNDSDIEFAQEHLAILSGLYGLLRPRDLIVPHRLEMSTDIALDGADNLYHFWRGKITAHLQEQLKAQQTPVLLNLASDTYAKTVDAAAFAQAMIHVGFRQRRGNALKNIGLSAKTARGKMVRAIVKKRIDAPQAVKNIRFDDYRFDESLSDETHYLFVQAA